MSATSADNELYASLAPIGSDSVLLPNVAVSDVIGLNALNPNDISDESSRALPAWFVGSVVWGEDAGERSIPVVSLEALCGREQSEQSRRTRLMIINSFGTAVSLGHFALVVSGQPHLVTLTKSSLEVSESIAIPEAAEPWILGAAALAGRQVWIPDLEAIESAISRVMKKQSREQKTD